MSQFIQLHTHSYVRTRTYTHFNPSTAPLKTHIGLAFKTDSIVIGKDPFVKGSLVWISRNRKKYIQTMEIEKEEEKKIIKLESAHYPRPLPLVSREHIFTSTGRFGWILLGRKAVIWDRALFHPLYSHRSKEINVLVIRRRFTPINIHMQHTGVAKHCNKPALILALISGGW